jgi:hypothetical protein
MPKYRKKTSDLTSPNPHHKAYPADWLLPKIAYWAIY